MDKPVDSCTAERRLFEKSRDGRRSFGRSRATSCSRSGLSVERAGVVVDTSGPELPRKNADLWPPPEEIVRWWSAGAHLARLGPPCRPSTRVREACVRAEVFAHRSPVDNPVEEGGLSVPSEGGSGCSATCGCRKTEFEVCRASAPARSLSEIAPLASAHAGTVEVHVSSKKVSRETTRTNAFRGSRARLRW